MELNFKDGYNKKGFSFSGIHKDTGTEYDQDGYNEKGYDKDGYNREGYDKDGYDREGYDKKGSDRRGFNREGLNIFIGEKYNRLGYDKDGYDRRGFDDVGIHRETGTKYDLEGYDKDGFGQDGYNKDGYDRDGYDKEGWNSRGFNRDGIHRETGTKYDLEGYDKDGFGQDGYDKDGYDRQHFDRGGWHKYNKLDREGYDEEGYNKKGFNREGIHRETGTKYDAKGYDREGYDEEGYNKKGFNREGINRETGTRYDKSGFDEQHFDVRGFNLFGHNRYTETKYDPEGYDKEGFGQDGYNKAGYDRDGYDKEGYNEKGFNRNGIDRHGYTEKGLHIDGYDEAGYDKNGYDRNGNDRNGINRKTGEVDKRIQIAQKIIEEDLTLEQFAEKYSLPLEQVKSAINDIRETPCVKEQLDKVLARHSNQYIGALRSVANQVLSGKVKITEVRDVLSVIRMCPEEDRAKLTNMLMSEITSHGLGIMQYNRMFGTGVDYSSLPKHIIEVLGGMKKAAGPKAREIYKEIDRVKAYQQPYRATDGERMGYLAKPTDKAPTMVDITDRERDLARDYLRASGEYICNKTMQATLMRVIKGEIDEAKIERTRKETRLRELQQQDREMDIQLEQTGQVVESK